MAIGDAVSVVANVADDDYLSLITSGAGVETIIHNISHNGSAELYFFDGSNYILMDTDTTAGAWMGLTIHCTFTNYYKVKNISGGTIYMHADGVCTKS